MADVCTGTSRNYSNNNNNNNNNQRQQVTTDGLLVYDAPPLLDPSDQYTVAIARTVVVAVAVLVVAHWYLKMCLHTKQRSRTIQKTMH
jgi:hypothetical protein